MLIKTLIWHKFEESVCGGDIVSELSEMIDYCMDDLSKPVDIWSVVRDSLWDVDQVTRYIGWANTPLLSGYMQNFINSHL